MFLLWKPRYFATLKGEVKRIHNSLFYLRTQQFTLLSCQKLNASLVFLDWILLFFPHTLSFWPTQAYWGLDSTFLDVPLAATTQPSYWRLSVRLHVVEQDLWAMSLSTPLAFSLAVHQVSELAGAGVTNSQKWVKFLCQPQMP